MTTETPGLFITGTNTEVGKTYIATLIIKALRSAGLRVGVYKPAASDCDAQGASRISEDARLLWEAAGKPGTMDQVCPQRFSAPLAPHLAARAEGRQVNPRQLRSGLEIWRDQYDFIIVEGVGGLMSPVSDDDYVADLAYEFRFPLVIVTVNELGCINQTLQTLITAAAFEEGLPVAGIIMNHRQADNRDDVSLQTNVSEIERCSFPPVLASVAYNGILDPNIDWLHLAQQTLK